MTISNEFVADEFLAAARAAGLKEVAVLVAQLDDYEFVVTLTFCNPVAVGENDRFLVSTLPYEFHDARDVKQIAAAKAVKFAAAIPTIH